MKAGALDRERLHKNPDDLEELNKEIAVKDESRCEADAKDHLLLADRDYLLLASRIVSGR